MSVFMSVFVSKCVCVFGGEIVCVCVCVCVCMYVCEGVCVWVCVYVCECNVVIRYLGASV